MFQVLPIFADYTFFLLAKAGRTAYNPHGLANA
jgi:hypothetical protein